ncbi:sensor domain-containing protein [Streptomyces tubbatahanensis]|uniref:histidine kinase n=1 Tax=Streptomyces tubbatahanensis TaxID=2923272 RepID=A0ABY3XUD6_9ACTN|nr:sensor domain-containing protein [Streptomyces tubbatahanensis]UNS98005.1 sensor domain-containing protein [Streptomyces tubbatahanensis]
MTATAASDDTPRAPATRKALRALAYAVAGLVPALLGLPALALVALGAVLCVTRAGIPVLSLALTAVRALTDLQRLLVRGLLGENVPPPPRPGPLRAAHDGATWRCAAFAVLNAPLGALLFAVHLPVRLYGLALLSYPLWFRAVHQNGHDGLELTAATPLDTWPRVWAVAAAGLLVLVLAEWAARRLTALVRLLARTLLAPLRLAERVHDLEETRALAVRDAATTLRRIERDLHDGAQVRIVALAMALTRAREALSAPEPSRAEADKARHLLDQSLGNARTALAELRDLVRGIHPPVLDNGLAPALASLSSDIETPALRVDLRTALPKTPRPAEAVETLAYFCAAELLANAARHAGAAHIAVSARTEEDDRMLVLVVEDDGRGGAAARPAGTGTSSGLRGLAERVRTVDGTLSLDSPPGGPTTATVRLPLAPRGETT